MRHTIAHNIAQSGQHMYAVFGDEKNHTPFIYTIGNHQRGLPELMVIGRFPPHVIGMMLNQMGATQRDKGKPYDEGIVDIGWSVPIKLRKCGERAKTEYTIQAGVYYGTQDYDVMQIMICDPEGRYQDDTACEYGVVDMP